MPPPNTLAVPLWRGGKARTLRFRGGQELIWRGAGTRASGRDLMAVRVQRTPLSAAYAGPMQNGTYLALDHDRSLLRRSKTAEQDEAETMTLLAGAPLSCCCYCLSPHSATASPIAFLTDLGGHLCALLASPAARIAHFPFRRYGVELP